MRIVFLGNEYHDLSLAVFSGLLETDHEIVVGSLAPESAGLFRAARNTFKHRGPVGVARAALKLLRAKLGARLRSRSEGDHAFASLGEGTRRNGLHLIDVVNVNDPATVREIGSLGPDLIIVGGFSRILRRPVIELPSLGCVNVHPSLLPAYRGPNPVYWAWANGERTTGVTVHFVDEGIDSGDIVAQRKVPIRPGDTERQVFDRCLGVAATLVRDVVSQFDRGEVERTPQSPDDASYYSHPPPGTSRL